MKIKLPEKNTKTYKGESPVTLRVIFALITRKYPKIKNEQVSKNKKDGAVLPKG